MNVVVIDIVALIIYIIGAVVTFVIMARLFGETDERDDNDNGIAWIGIMVIWPIVLLTMGFLKLSKLADQIACKIHDSFEDESESSTDDGIGLFERHN